MKIGPDNSGPSVEMPGRDVMIPQPKNPNGMITLQQLGQPCGHCMCPPTYTAGQCERHLVCVHHPYIADAPGTCMEQGKTNYTIIIIISEKSQIINSVMTN